MDAARWHQLRTLLEPLLAAEGEQRAQLLEQACQGDEGLRAELLSLLSVRQTFEAAVQFHEERLRERPFDRGPCAGLTISLVRLAGVHQSLAEQPGVPPDQQRIH